MTPEGTSQPQRVLFVDDEQSILHGLARMLHPLRNELQAEFVQTGKGALELLAKQSFDVVVADLRMPGMDGAALLGEVQKRHPHLLRIVFSGQSEIEAALRAVPVAHQFIAKPCEAETLRGVIARAVSLRELLADSTLRSIVAGIKELPARPKIFKELTALLSDPNSGAQEIARVVKRDSALCAKILHIVNSAFFGLPRKTTSVDIAINYLGTSMLRAVTLATTINTALAARARAAGYDLEAAQNDVLLSAHVAAQMFEKRNMSQDAFSAALLQNVGEVLLLVERPEAFAKVTAYARENGMSLDAAERELGVVSHAHVGAYLLGTWGVPYSITEAVAHHHDPQHVPHESFEIVDAVYAAALITRHVLTGEEAPLAEATAYLERHSHSHRLAVAMSAAERWLKGESTEPGSDPPTAKRDST